jgi:hypothetical protein
MPGGDQVSRVALSLDDALCNLYHELIGHRVYT